MSFAFVDADDLDGTQTALPRSLPFCKSHRFAVTGSFRLESVGAGKLKILPAKTAGKSDMVEFSAYRSGSPQTQEISVVVFGWQSESC